MDGPVVFDFLRGKLISFIFEDMRFPRIGAAEDGMIKGEGLDNGS